MEYKTIDTTKWALIEAGPLTVSGCHEIVASFLLKGDAEYFVRDKYGRNWRQRFVIQEVNR